MSMKKLTALLCTAAMTMSLSATAFANPSITTVFNEKVEVQAETSVVIPEGKKVVVTKAAPENYKVKEVADVVSKVNNPEEKAEVAEIVATLKALKSAEELVGPTGEPLKEAEFVTTSGNVVDTSVYDFVTEFADLALTDDVTMEYSLDGEVVSVKTTLTMEALIDADIENMVIMQIDPETGDVYFIELKAEDFDPVTGELTVTFPCLGPFSIMEKPADAVGITEYAVEEAAAEEAATEAATEAVTEAVTE